MAISIPVTHLLAEQKMTELTFAPLPKVGSKMWQFLNCRINFTKSKAKTVIHPLPQKEQPLSTDYSYRQGY